MSNMNNPTSRATKADIKAARKAARSGNLPATTKPATNALTTKPEKPAKAPKEKTAPDVNRVTLAALARELKKDPKTVRARFRRMYDQDADKKLPQPIDSRQRWTFNVADRDALTALINAE